MKVLVVGGGTAGLVSALILKRKLDIQVDLVHSPNIGIIGVGEGSTEHFSNFMEFMGIDSDTIIKRCGATFKSGIMFEGWSEKPYLHSITQEFTPKVGQYFPVIAEAIIQNVEITSKHTWKNNINEIFTNPTPRPPFFQYHFDTFKLNEFLTELAKEMHINIYEDDIKDIILKSNGDIDYIVGEKQNYDYNFYIDSTGFKRILMNKLGAEWVSFGKYLKMKAAITFPSPAEDEYNLWTLAKAMDYGWMFRLPVQERYGNGYIYDSDYITEDQAKIEVEKYFGREIEIGRTFKFDPGCVDRFWIKNCVAVGLSGSFFEPLEATSIGTTIQQTFLLMHRLINYDDSSINYYNKSMNSVVENIRDFLILHYLTNKNNTKFWEDVSKIEIPESLNNKIKLWKNHLPIHEDFIGASEYNLFWPENFLFVMNGLNMFNKNSIEKEFYALNESIVKYSKHVLKNIASNDNSMRVIGHKNLISIIKER
jgi:tryptophan halogenase